jgi:hypothetical protein
LAAPSPAQAARKMEVALQDDGVFLYNEYAGNGYDRERGLRDARAMGVTHIRMNIYWWQAVPPSQRNSKSKPSNIVYDFRLWDAAIARAKAYGIKTQLTLAGDPPAYACGNKKIPYSCDGFKPNRKLFAHFARAVAKHFKGDVKRYSVWNEPNWYTWISPHKSSALIYRRLYQAGYKAIKKANRKAEVVLGELAPHSRPRRSIAPLEFLRDMVCVNKRLKRTKKAKKNCKGKLKFDGFAMHPYDFENKPTKVRKNRDEVTMANIGALPKFLSQLRKKRLIKPKKKKFPIYLTETGYMVADNPKVPRARRVPEGTRQKYLVKAWKLAQKAPQVKQMLHYVFVSPPATSPSAYFDLGLVTINGTPRGSYFALGDWIKDAARSGKVQKPGRCTAC